MVKKALAGLAVAASLVAPSTTLGHSTGGKTAAYNYTLRKCTSLWLPHLCRQNSVKVAWWSYRPGEHLTIYNTSYQEWYLVRTITHHFCVYTKHGAFLVARNWSC